MYFSSILKIIKAYGMSVKEFLEKALINPIRN